LIGVRRADGHEFPARLPRSRAEFAPVSVTRSADRDFRRRPAAGTPTMLTRHFVVRVGAVRARGSTALAAQGSGCGCVASLIVQSAAIRTRPASPRRP